MEHVAEALRMLEAFASIGVKRFSVTQTDIQQNQVKPYWPGVNVAGMKLLLADAVPRAWEHSQNLILRPHPAAGGVLAQLDDLDLRKLESVRSRSFLTLETSPGNYQAWLFVESGNDDVIRQMVRGMEVDWNASRAVRVAGTPNCKLKYAPDFPVVRVDGVGSRVRFADLKDWLPLSSVVPAIAPAPVPVVQRAGQPTRFPSYEMTLNRAPESSSGGKQRKIADFTWSCTAADWGWSADDIARKLMEVSSKAKENGERYVRETAEAAVDRVTKNGSWRKR